MSREPAEFLPDACDFLEREPYHRDPIHSEEIHSETDPVLLSRLGLMTLALAAGIAPSAVAQARGHSHSFEVWEMTIPELQAALEAGDTTSKELVELYVERIETYDQDGPRLNALRHLNRNALQNWDHSSRPGAGN